MSSTLSRASAALRARYAAICGAGWCCHGRRQLHLDTACSCALASRYGGPAQTGVTGRFRPRSEQTAVRLARARGRGLRVPENYVSLVLWEVAHTHRCRVFRVARCRSAGDWTCGLQTDQFAKPGILPPDSKQLHAGKRARLSCATLVATSTCVLVAAAHPGAGAVLQTAQLISCCFPLAIGISGGRAGAGGALRKGDRLVRFEAVRCHGAATGHIQHAGTVPATERSS